MNAEPGNPFAGPAFIHFINPTIMVWFPFAFFAAIVTASRRTYDKRLSAELGSFTMGFVLQAFSLLPTLLLCFILPVPKDLIHLSWRFWCPLLAVWFLVYPPQTYCLYTAIRRGQLSEVMPVLSLVPVLNVLSSLLFMKEYPSLYGYIGIVFIVFASFLTLFDGKTEKEKETKFETAGPGVKYNKAVVYMMIASACMAIGSSLNKVAIRASTPAYYSFADTFGAAIVLGVLALCFKEHTSLQKIPSKFGLLSMIGIAQALGFTATMIAFQNGPTSYTLAIRSLSYIFAALLGVKFFKEKFTVRKRCAFALYVAGIILLTVIN